MGKEMKRIDNYTAPECEVLALAAGSLVCVSGNATGEDFGLGRDYGGKDRWEAGKW